MTRDDVVALFKRRQEALSRLDASVLANLHAPDGVLESPMAGGSAEGREAIEQVYRKFFTAMSPRIEQEALLVDGVHVAHLVHMEGTHRGGLMGLPDSGRPFSFSMVSLCEMRDGFIVHERRIYDFTGLLVQVGAIKAKPVSR
jgi:predicted ester cyclase